MITLRVTYLKFIFQKSLFQNSIFLIQKKINVQNIGKMDKTEMIDGFVRYSIEQNQENRLDKKNRHNRQINSIDN